uniref:Uncharacterized protein n=1 Tax=Parastrongyloides trichosuri TaxID=131310 RepID=A0A0N4Z0N9_PARTI
MVATSNVSKKKPTSILESSSTFETDSENSRSKKSIKRRRKRKGSRKPKKSKETSPTTSSSTTEKNPYRNLDNFDNRLFTLDTIMDINKNKDILDSSYDKDVESKTILDFKKNDLKLEYIEKNPYSEAYKNADCRTYTRKSLSQMKKTCVNSTFNFELSMPSDCTLDLNKLGINLSQYLPPPQPKVVSNNENDKSSDNESNGEITKK